MFFSGRLVYNNPIEIQEVIMYYLLNSSMQPLDDHYQKKDGDTLVSVVTTEECGKLHGSLPYYNILARNIQNHNIQYCKAEMLPDCIVGTLLIPDKQSLRQHILSLSFYLEKGLLVFVDDTRHMENILSMFREAELLSTPNTAAFFCRLLEYLISEDGLFLQQMEQEMAALEDRIQQTRPVLVDPVLLQSRRQLLILNSYYQQLLDFCETMKENSNHFFTKAECQSFSINSARVERLYNHSRMLREYALQIREMYQTQMDIRQNHTMQLLTVVTAIFLPLTLITGWYGMNFRNMPELQTENGYFILIFICILIVAVEIWLFRKNHWL